MTGDILVNISNILISIEGYHTGLRKKTVWLISTRSFWSRFYHNHLATGWQMSSHRVQLYCALQASRPVIIELEQVLINRSGQAIEFRHLQHMAPHLDDVTVRFQEIDPQEKGFCEGVCFCKSVHRTKQRQDLLMLRYF